LLLLVGCGDGMGRFDASDTRIDTANIYFDPDSAGARICTDGVGGIYAAWTDDRDGPDSVWFNRSHDGGTTWMTDAVLISGGWDAREPDIACSGSDVHIVWTDTRDGELQHPNGYVASSLDGGTTFSEPMLLERDTSGRFLTLQPRISAGGSFVHITWMNNRYGAYDVFALSSADRGTSFTQPENLTGSARGAAWSGNPTIASDTLGNAVVAWEDTGAGGSDIHTAFTADAGQSWTGAQRIDTGVEPGLSDAHNIAMDFDGTELTVVWHDSRKGTGWGVFANQWSGGQWLPEAINIDQGVPGNDAMSPTVTVVGSTAHVVWHDDRYGSMKVLYRSLTGGVLGMAPVQLNGGHSLAHGLYPQIQSSDGALVVVWEDTRMDGSGTNNDLFYDLSDDGGMTWREVDLRINSNRGGSTFALDPSIVVEAGELLTAWVDGRNETADIYFNRLALGEAAHTPEGTPAEPTDEVSSETEGEWQ